MGVSLKKMKAAHKPVAKLDIEPAPIQRGYCNRSLYVNVGTGELKIEPVTQQMKDVFVGGKGFDLWTMWNKTTAETCWDSPENVICISGGPLCGTSTYPGAGKALVTSISPTTGIPIDSNVGGYAGPFLKLAGFDLLCVQGKAKRDVIIFIDARNNRVSVEEAPLEAVDSHPAAHTFHEMYAESEADLVNVSVISAGRGAEHTRMGCLNFSWWDVRRKTARLKQAGRGGIGTVFRDKKIKAIVFRVDDYRPKWTITVD